ncbi:MAG TPA: N-6 DNA methylase, partial [Bacillota bacterium]|nr:N-6 DNA methylase [Bacillota bacterium]
MITGEMKSKVDSIWDTIWTGGITSPITVLEQITYLMFMKLLDDNQIKAEAGANALGIKLKKRVFGEGICVISEEPRLETDYKNLRWNVFHNFEPSAMLTNVQTYVFPFIKQIGEGKDTAFSRYMKDTVFLIPTAKVLAKVVDGIDAMDMNNKDIMGDVYEYLLGKIAAAGENGQFRTPRHIIRMMVELMKPTLDDRILDPAMGSAGFLLESSSYINNHFAKELMRTDNANYY